MARPDPHPLCPSRATSLPRPATLTKHVTTPDDDMKEYVSFHLTRAERHILIEFLRSLPDE